MPSEYGDGGLHRGPLTMAIFSRKEDMLSEDGDWVVNWGPLIRWLSLTGSKICIQAVFKNSIYRFQRF